MYPLILPPLSLILKLVILSFSLLPTFSLKLLSQFSMEEAQEEVLMINNKDQQSHNNIVKGKRTKRQRPQSPVPFIVNSTIHDNTNLSSSPAVSSAEEFLDSTEEDEDMANCLILLAQCQSIRESPKPKPARYDIHEQEEIAQLQINNNINNSGMKFNSRRFLEAPGTGAGKGGCYVYECKTCNRTFPSFQALGGHRASHKKPKVMLMNDDRLSLKSQHQQQQQQQYLVSKSDDEDDGNFRNVSSLSLQLSNNNRGNNNNNNISFFSGNNNNNSVVKVNNSKVHECSICGAEFTSGQALGGHMRRHRSAPIAATAATTTNTTLSLTPMAVVEAGQDQPRKSSSSSSSSRNNHLSLDLDLNLPAPEDDPKESKLPISSKQQQHQQQKQQQQPPTKSSLVFTAAAALVDCHY